MKRILILLSLLFIYPIASFGQEINSCISPFQTGIYGGIRVGLSHLHSKFESTTEYIGYPELRFDHNSRIRSSFGSGGIQFGYLYNCQSNPLIFAPEVFFIYSPSSMSLKDEGRSIKTTFSFGTNIRVGVLLTDNILVYGFTGVTCSRLEFQVRDINNNKLFAHQTKFGAALNYGVGVEHELENTHRIRLEVGCSDYKTLDFLTIADDKISYYSAKVRPKACSVNFMYSVPF